MAMNGVNKKAKRRLFSLTIILILIISALSVGLYNSWCLIIKNNKEIKTLNQKNEELLTNEVSLNKQLLRLQDKDYIARYAKEKYSYSADGDTIIKIVK